jgi:hypothetical protein
MYYVKVMTRSSGARRQGSPRNAIDYITDGHDLRRDPGYSDAELAYIARAGDGWKTDLEGGRVELVGAGALKDISDQEELAARFEGACQPWHDRRGTTGYKSFTLTVPKEMSLYAEGHREAAKSALYAAMRDALDAAFPGKDYTAVAAIHTRNEAGEVHYHVHVLVAKFARDRSTGAVRSLNSKAGGNTGARMHDLKRAWKAAVDLHVERELGVRLEQGAPYARPALVLPDGRRIAPLNRDGRRALDQMLSAKCAEKLGGRARFRLNDKMDGRIFELASAPGGWSAAAFVEHFPAQARFLDRFEKRIETLKRVGYLTDDLHVTPEFRTHYCARNGIDTPELQRIRLDIASAANRESRRTRTPVAVPSLWQAVERFDSIRRRVERLGLSRQDLERIQSQAHRLKPTPENLRAVREALIEQELRSTRLPDSKHTVVRAFCDIQRARMQAFFLVTSGAARLRFGESKRLANELLRNAHRDYRAAKKQRLVRLARRFRPVFGLTRVVMPDTTAKLKRELERAARKRAMGLYSEFERQAKRAWRTGAPPAALSGMPANDLVAAEKRLNAAWHPQNSGTSMVAPASAGAKDANAVAQLTDGLRVLQTLEPSSQDVRAFVARWVGHERELVERVLDSTKNQAGALPPHEYQIALRAGRVGYLLARERSFRAPGYPDTLSRLAPELARASARLRAHGAPDPFSARAVSALSPRALDRALGFLRDARVLSEGADWTQAAKQARSLGTHLNKAIEDELLRNKSSTR